eukprot:TRINITY_DN1847_c0_g1_i1.p1 TRINITY_DN1847_c0_g1~~TRINITY_DN1847_c0_g1_i1.p1  ORF type:complete len:101 (+),score=2.22 TRINITY_DN1847_c0_g1_i1:55-357(+)
MSSLGDPPNWNRTVDKAWSHLVEVPLEGSQKAWVSLFGSYNLVSLKVRWPSRGVPLEGCLLWVECAPPLLSASQSSRANAVELYSSVLDVDTTLEVHGMV